jgi:hypothetical protein
MKLRNFIGLALIVYISIIQISARDLYRKSILEFYTEKCIGFILGKENDDLFRQLRRRFFKNDPTSKRAHSPRVIEELVFTTSTRTTPRWTYQSTSSPYYKPSGSCASNPCQHGGYCISTSQTSYECRCVGPWRGVTCNVGM